MSRESNDAFEAYAARKGYVHGTWNYIRAAKAWNAALSWATDATQPSADPIEPASPVAEESRGSRLQQQGGRMADLGTLPRYGSRHHNCITFAELVEHGRKSGADIVDGMPWHFQFNGAPVTHENDESYLVMGKHGDVRFTSGDLLFTDEIGAFYTSPIPDYVAFLEVARYGKVAPVACHTSAWVGWHSATSTTPQAAQAAARPLAAIQPSADRPVCTAVNFEFETLPPLEGMDRIYGEYAKTFGRFPDAFMAQVVAQTKEDLFMWWAAHREVIRAALAAPHEAETQPNGQEDKSHG